MWRIQGIIIDSVYRRKFNGEVLINDGKIAEVIKTEKSIPNQYIMPGFVD